MADQRTASGRAGKGHRNHFVRSTACCLRRLAINRLVTIKVSQAKEKYLVLGAGILGTSAITAFSHLLSKLADQNFSEPDLLSSFYKDWNLPERISSIAGWASHYAVGAAFRSPSKHYKRKKQPEGHPAVNYTTSNKLTKNQTTMLIIISTKKIIPLTR